MNTLRDVAWNINRLIAQNGGPISRVLFRAANLYVKTYKNLNYDMNTNGEYYILDCLKSQAILTVLDVGANKGEYTSACLSRFPHAEIHSFEIVPATYQKLITNVGTEKNVFLNNFGLSDTKGIVQINYNADDDGSSSIIEGSNIHNGQWEKVEVDVIKGDDYLVERNINSVDLLKVDVEGAEHLVLNGFSKSFENGRISAVQFEYGMVNIYSKFLLKDFWDLFSKYGFAIGPLMPRGVDFKEYNTRDEDFQGTPNFIAVHRSKINMIEAVRLK
ncbi:MAG: hypothetical protein QOI53_3005 [Verrucomicrobiota bacterium]|nr:hypothetical protein [Verrucomicrobiota bacterium]